MNNREVKKLGLYDDSVFIADGVQLSGPENIKIGKDVNIWYNSVLRSSGKDIVIGDRTNIQDGSVIHIATNGGTYIGADVTIGCLLYTSEGKIVVFDGYEMHGVEGDFESFLLGQIAELEERKDKKVEKLKNRAGR